MLDAKKEASRGELGAWQRAARSRGLRLVLLFVVLGGALAFWLNSLGGAQALLVSAIGNGLFAS